MSNFFYYVGKFFKNFPAVVFVCLAYLMGVRPYHLMVNFTDEPASVPPHIFRSKLLPPSVDPNSADAFNRIVGDCSLFDVDGFFTFKGFEPAPFWSYLWNEVWMDWA
jgi:hypothetical protein